jgi:hypothetical protein
MTLYLLNTTLEPDHGTQLIEPPNRRFQRLFEQIPGRGGVHDEGVEYLEVRVGQQRAQGFGLEGAREFAVTFDTGHDGFFVVSCQCHFHAITGCNAASGSTSRSIVRAFS